MKKKNTNKYKRKKMEEPEEHNIQTSELLHKQKKQKNVKVVKIDPKTKYITNSSISNDNIVNSHSQIQQQLNIQQQPQQIQQIPQQQRKDKKHKSRKYQQKKINGHKSHKNTSMYGSNFSSFFQKNFAKRSKFVASNSLPFLRTSHKTYYPTVPRIIVIGDIHGDLDKLIDCLLLSKCIALKNPNVKLPENNTQRSNEVMFRFIQNLKWTGGGTYIVQLGDQVDRIRPTNWDSNNVPVGNANNDEGSSLHIFYILWYLNTLAKSYNGRVISLMGNHEFMNVDGDFRYVSPQEFNEYHNAFHRFYTATLHPENEDLELITQIRKEISTLQNIPKGYQERRIAWHPNGIIANFMGLNYKTCVHIGKWLFVHAGLTTNLCQGQSICKINNAISRYLLNYNSSMKDDIPEYKDDCAIYNRIINCSGDYSPVWNRDFGDNETDERENRKITGKFKLLISEYNKSNKTYLDKFNVPQAEYCAIGHTPQFHDGKGINSTCGGKVWRCDVGMSRAFRDGNNNEFRRPQVLEILNDDIINVLG
jgi:hypothetical protein